MMDLFYQELSATSKLRTHFHDFMLDVHERIHTFKTSLPPSHVNDVSKFWELVSKYPNHQLTLYYVINHQLTLRPTAEELRPNTGSGTRDSQRVEGALF